MTDTHLFELLKSHPARFDAATALRVAETEARRSGRRVVTRTVPAGAATPQAITAVRESADLIELETPIMGLLGPLSPLPPAYGVLAARDQRRRAGGFLAFIDMFSDRLTWLFAEVTEKYSLPRRLRWSAAGHNKILLALRALIGFATPGLQRETPLPGDETLRYAGLYAQRTRGAVGLRQILSAELGLPVEIEQFHLRWRALPRSEQTRMSGAVVMDRDATAGSRFPDRTGQIRVRIGPVRYGDFVSLEEGQPRLERIRRLTRLYVGPVIDFDFQIVLDRRDIPETQLSREGPGARLDWNCWARSLPAEADSEDAIVGSAARVAA
ncbi:type VI secretion system baseplate subunit TssG [Ruegeria jejuensis]|uniref:type VI secretion system baseplate subunit TssG n=1 Tax=Ruegeria jejuensis TaxID=3233338 RepID=UPI00355AFB3D